MYSEQMHNLYFSSLAITA